MLAGSRLRRLFFALWPPQALCEQLERNTRRLVRDSGGRPIPLQNFHVTIAFLGDVPESCLPAVLAAAAATASPGFTLALDGIETWHVETRGIKAGRIDVGSRSGVLVLSGATTPPELAALVTHLRNNLSSRLLSRPITVTPESRSSPEGYRPHITLARNLPRASAVPDPVPGSLPGSQPMAMTGTAAGGSAQWRIEWPVSEFVLVDSIKASGSTSGSMFGAKPAGSNYQVLGRWQLA